MANMKMGRFFNSRKYRRPGRPIKINHPKYSDAWRDLSDIEEKGDRLFFTEVGALAAINAINENKAMDIPVTFMEDGWVVRRMPQGNIERVVKIENNAGVARNKKLTKGTVLHVKKSR